MNFDQLSPDRQAELIEKERQSRYEDSDTYWSECCIEGWKEKLEEHGFRDAEIMFSGFSCQGDGASFTGWLADKLCVLPTHLQDKMDTAKLVKTTTRRLEGNDRPVEFEVEIGGGIIRSGHHYVHEKSIDCQLQVHYSRDIPEPLENMISDWSNAYEKELTEKAQDLSREIYRDLEKEWDYYTGDESIIESLSGEEYAEELQEVEV